MRGDRGERTTGPVTTLGARALGRAFLARQGLLERRVMDTEGTIEHLVGMQAQAPLSPYVGLWSRLAGFEPETLSSALEERRVVRTSLMRSTIHLVTARDALFLRPLIQPIIERGFRASPFGRRVAGLDLSPILAEGRAMLEAGPMTNTEMARRFAERWPDLPTDSMVFAIGYLVPLVHAPPRGRWGRTGPVSRVEMERWLGQPLDVAPSLDALVLRYLGAFGPATVADVGAWSGLARLGPVVERLRPQLATFLDPRGRELLDLPDAPRPDPDTPAPVRFLPEYDNVLLGHADRRRIIPAGRRIPLPPGNGATRGTFLLDGMFAGEWRIARQRGRRPVGATLSIEPFEAVTRADRQALADEAAALLAFATDGLDGEIVITPPTG